MRYTGRIVFKHADGSIELYGPGAPVRGVYSVGDQEISVDDLGDGRTAPSIKEIDRLDALVLAGAATFTPAETEQQYWQRIHDRTKASVPNLANAQWVATIPEAEHLNKDRYFRGAWAWLTPDLVIDIDIARARNIQTSRIENQRRVKIRDLLEREALGENVAADKAALRAINSRALCQAAQTPEELKAVIPDILR